MSLKVSVCISTWNRREELSDLLESVYKQNYPDFDVTVVDNCSSDDTLQLLTEYENKYDNFTYGVLDEPHPSACYTLNLSFNLSDGDYILVLDDDSLLIETDTISRMVKLMEENLNAAIVGSNVLDINGNVAIQFKHEAFNTVNVDDLDKLSPFKYVDFSGACAMFRREMVEQVGFYDEPLTIYWNEAKLALEMIARGYDVIFAPDIKSVHVASLTNRVQCRNHFHYIINGNKIINENLCPRERLLLVPLRSLVYSVSYIKQCHPKWTVIIKLIYELIKCHIHIVIGKRNSYVNNNQHAWVRKIYTKFFWKDIYYFIFTV